MVFGFTLDALDAVDETGRFDDNDLELDRFNGVGVIVVAAAVAVAAVVAPFIPFISEF